MNLQINISKNTWIKNNKIKVINGMTLYEVKWMNEDEIFKKIHIF